MTPALGCLCYWSWVQGVGGSPVQFIDLILVRTSHQAFLSGVFALPNHANLKHVWGEHLCDTHEVRLDFSSDLPAYRILGIEDLALKQVSLN